MTNTFENALVGDKVWSYAHNQYGTITKILVLSKYPIKVTLSNGMRVERTLGGKIDSTDSNQDLFWDEIKFDIPTQPVRTKLINGYAVPDISFEPKDRERYYFPLPSYPALVGDVHFEAGNAIDEHSAKYNLCYPYTEEGKKAAILHTKAMLGIEGKE